MKHLCSNFLRVEGTPEDMFQFVKDSEEFCPITDRLLGFSFHAHFPVPKSLLDQKRVKPKGLWESFFGVNKHRAFLHTIKAKRTIRDWQLKHWGNKEILRGAFTLEWEKDYVNAVFITEGINSPQSIVEAIIARYPNLNFKYEWKVRTKGTSGLKYYYRKIS